MQKIKEEQIGDKKVKVKLWDTAGQETYHSLIKNYYRKSDGIIIVFDICNKDSFDKISYWVKSINDNADSRKDIKRIIVGNKIDLAEERKITKEEAEKMASAYSVKYFEASAKDNIGVNDFILSIVTDIIKEREKEKEKKDVEGSNDNIELEQKKVEGEKKGWCC